MGNLLKFLEIDTKGKCYRSHKYCVDDIEMPKVLYDDEKTQRISVKKQGETAKLKQTKNLKPLADKVSQNGKPLFRYFLDGSRRIYKVDDIAYISNPLSDFRLFFRMKLKE